MRAATDGRLLCRINGFGPWTGGEVDEAIARGADEILLPMVRTPEEVDRTLDLVAGRCGLGILVETQDAVDRVGALARRPLSRIYVGLNDLRIDRRSDQLFRPLVDGTVDAVRAAGDPAVRRRRADAARLRLPGAQRPAGRRAGPAGHRLHLPAAVVHRRHGRPRPVRRGAAAARLARRAPRRPIPWPPRGRRARFLAATGQHRRAGRAWRSRRESARHRCRRLRRPAPGRPADRRRLGRRAAHPRRRSTWPTRSPPRPRCGPPTPTSCSPSPPAGPRPRPPSGPPRSRSTPARGWSTRCPTGAAPSSGWAPPPSTPPRPRRWPRTPPWSRGASSARPRPPARCCCRRPPPSAGVRAAVLRAFQVYGPGDHPTRLVPVVLDAARTGATVPLPARLSRRDWVWVGDVVDACVRAAADDALPPGVVLNIGTGVQTSTEELVATAAAVTGRPIATAAGAHPGPRLGHRRLGVRPGRRATAPGLGRRPSTSPRGWPAPGRA